MPLRKARPTVSARHAMRAALSALVALTGHSAASMAVPASVLPEIRTGQDNTVPACVTPERLMRYLGGRNRDLAPRFRDIARWYRHHGERWRVRWDFAFFQMALETNFLSYRRADGRPGDVDPAQNNFAGIGATGGGVPGDRFPDVGTGVLAQIQHLVAYSGEPLARPVAPRTALKQDIIIAASRRLNRPVRFSDLARRWAADPRYGASIAAIADGYYATWCNGRRDAAANAGPKPLERTATARSHLLGSGDARRVAIALPPPPRPAAQARARVVMRTIWRRPEQAGKSEATNASDVSGDDATVVKSSGPDSVDAALDAGANGSGLLAGLQAIAQSIDWPVIAPRPQIALRNRTD